MNHRLTEAQRKALDTINTDGVLFMGNGVSIATVKALHNAGLIEMTAKVVNETSPRTGVPAGRTITDWMATPAN